MEREKVEQQYLKLCKDCKYGGVQIDGKVRTWVCRAADELALISPITGDLLVGMVSDCASQRFGGFCGIEGKLWQQAGGE